MVIVITILIYNIFSKSPTAVKEKVKPSLDTYKKKKVSFNLEKNEVYTIPNNKKKANYIYGNKVMNNNSSYNINNKIIYPQQKLINRLNKDQIQITSDEKKQFTTGQSAWKAKGQAQPLEKDDIFIDQNSYWNSLNIGDFTERQYLNSQINDFNIFKKNNKSYKNMKISKVYDDLTNGSTNTYKLLHDDNSVLKSDNIIDGFSYTCNNLEINTTGSKN